MAEKKTIVKCCAGCAEKLSKVGPAGRNTPNYILVELGEEPRPTVCPLCFTPAHLSRYELTRRPVRYARRNGGGERERARG